MLPKKLFLPLGGGEELKERIRGALLISKYLEAHLEVLRAENANARPGVADFFAPDYLVKEMSAITDKLEKGITEKYKEVFKEVCTELGIEITDDVKPEKKPTASLLIDKGKRGELVARYSKLCDMVIAVRPPDNIPTATFQAAVLYSGKPVMMIPRVLTSFDPSRIIILWNASTEASRAIDGAMPFLIRAKEVMIVTRKNTEGIQPTVAELQKYLAIHGINAKYEIVIPTKTPGEALLNKAIDGGYGLIVAGAYGQNRVKESVFGGFTTYMLEHTTIPLLTAH
jgi:nucleotide-binding universal stress UspA family protein